MLEGKEERGGRVNMSKCSLYPCLIRISLAMLREAMSMLSTVQIS